MPRIIWVFAGRTVTLLVLSCRGSHFFTISAEACWLLFQVFFVPSWDSKLWSMSITICLIKWPKQLNIHSQNESRYLWFLVKHLLLSFKLKKNSVLQCPTMNPRKDKEQFLSRSIVFFKGRINKMFANYLHSLFLMFRPILTFFRGSHNSSACRILCVLLKKASIGLNVRNKVCIIIFVSFTFCFLKVDLNCHCLFCNKFSLSGVGVFTGKVVYTMGKVVAQSSFEPIHEIMALIALRKLNLHSHPMGLHVWFFVRSFVYFFMCANSEGSGETAHSGLGLRCSPMR